MGHYDPFDYRIQENPHPTYRQRRDEAPAYYNAQREFRALSRCDDVHSANVRGLSRLPMTFTPSPARQP